VDPADVAQQSRAGPGAAVLVYETVRYETHVEV